MSVKDLYEREIRQLPATEKFELAKMIINDISLQSDPNYSDNWSDEDMRDLTNHVLTVFENRYPAEEDLV